MLLISPLKTDRWRHGKAGPLPRNRDTRNRDQKQRKERGKSCTSQEPQSQNRGM